MENLKFIETALDKYNAGLLLTGQNPVKVSSMIEMRTDYMLLRIDGIDSFICLDKDSFKKAYDEREIKS